MLIETSRDNACKEAFRQQAIAAGVADECVIDKEGYAEIGLVAGCFKGKDGWVVYCTDERCEVYNEDVRDTCVEAYKELGERFGFYFKF